VRRLPAPRRRKPSTNTNSGVDAMSLDCAHWQSRRARAQNEEQLSAVNVYLKESNGSLPRTYNARISLYGSVYAHV
jgi:hypothetical protein